MTMVPSKCTSPFLQAGFPRAGKRKRDLLTDSLEELIQLQSRLGRPCMKHQEFHAKQPAFKDVSVWAEKTVACAY